MQIFESIKNTILPFKSTNELIITKNSSGVTVFSINDNCVQFSKDEIVSFIHILMELSNKTIHSTGGE